MPSSVGGELARLVVEGFDLLGDGEVLVGDGLVGDARVDHGHGEGLVAEQGGDGVEAHPAVDGLGGQGVAELVRGDVADARVGAEPAQRGGDAQRGDGTVAFEQEPVGAQAGGPVVGDPVVEQRLELRVQGDVAVVVELADRDAEPVGGADLDDGVDGERPELARAHPGAGQQLDDQRGRAGPHPPATSGGAWRPRRRRGTVAAACRRSAGRRRTRAAVGAGAG